MRQVITIALTEEEYKRWEIVNDDYSQYDLFIMGLEIAEEAELRKKEV